MLNMKKTDILLMLLAGDNNRPIVGTTRLQKLLFLVEHEKKIRSEEGSFNFEAFKFGPASKTLYDDIEFLLNIGFLEKTGEDSSIDNLSLEDLENVDVKRLLRGVTEAEGDEYEDEEIKKREKEDEMDENTVENDSIVYRITEKGIDYLRENNLLNSNEAEQINNVRKKYGRKSLVELLKYIYTKYPKYTTESEIKDQLL